MELVSLDAQLDSAEFREDPYPTYRQLLELESPFWSDSRKAWLLARFDDVVGAFRDVEHFSNEERLSTTLDHLSEEDLKRLRPLREYASRKGLVHSDPPHHTVLRRLLQPSFSRGALERLRPRIQVLVDGLLRNAVDRGSMDVVADFARPLPVAVICELLGVPQADQSRFLQWSDQLHPLQGAKRPPLSVALEAQAGYVALYDYMDALLRERRHALAAGRNGGDLLTSLVRAQGEAGVSDPDLTTTCVTLLSAGFQATSQAIANSVLLLLQHPEQLELARRQPDLAPAVVEESLRYEPPCHSVPRRIKTDVTLGHSRMRSGDLALLVVAAANRDPRHFDDPDTFDITRRSQRHLALGSGVHMCIGAPLARLEGPIAIRSLLATSTRIEMLDDVVELSGFKPNGRCPVALHIGLAA